MKRNRWFSVSAVLAFLILVGVLTTACGKNGDSGASESAKANDAATPAATVKAEETKVEPIKVKIGLDTAATGSPQFRVAKEKGFFKKYGIEVETSDFPYGIDTINAMLVNRTDTGSAADYALLNSLGKGDFTIVSTISRGTEATAKNLKLLVNDKIKTEQDLKGKKLGVARATAFEYTWSKYLEKLGIDPKDVKIVNYSSPDEAVVGVKKGDIDAVWANGALRDKLLEGKKVTPLVDGTATGIYTNAFFIVQRKFVEEHPDAVSNILKALNEATKYIKANYEETADILFNTIKLPKEGVLRDLKATDYVIGFTQKDYKDLEEMHAWLVAKGTLKDDYKLKDKIVIGPLKKAIPDAVTYEP